jgi:hypothetical protein
MRTYYQHHINLYRVALFIFCGVFCSCKKFIDTPRPKTQIETSQVFENDQSALAAMAGLYNRLIINNLIIMNGGITVFSGLSADELVNTSTPSPDDEFRTNTLQSNNFSISGYLWQAAYTNIYDANAILEGLSNSSVTQSLKMQLRGEALVVRSLNYFYLINLFADVPLITETNYKINQSMPRTPVSQIYQGLVTDLREAKTLLADMYPSSERVRPNKWTATALLARIYLYQKDWAKAEEQATEIINSGLYSMPTDLNDVFLSGSDETIWSLVQDKSNTAEGQTFIPAFSFLTPAYIITDSLLNKFEAGDERKVKWLNSTMINGQTVYFPYKYKQGWDFSAVPPPPTEYCIVFRLAEQYLIRAEARAQLNDIAGGQVDLNILRNRAGLPNIIANDQPSLLTAIEHERQIEFFAEWGHRWLDLKRTDRANVILGMEKSPNWQATDVLYPIPFDQIQLNPFLTQNSGY